MLVLRAVVWVPRVVVWVPQAAAGQCCPPVPAARTVLLSVRMVLPSVYLALQEHNPIPMSWMLLELHEKSDHYQGTQFWRQYHD